MSVYTRTGDTGETHLLGNLRAPKDDPVFDVLGTLDEFNATLGIVLADISFSSEAENFIITIQSDLFKLGALIANPKSKEDDFKWLDSRVTTIENYIDDLEKDLPELRNFILPGGTPGSARVHLARTVCRRLERNFVKHFQLKSVGKTHAIKFINRLSDLLFVLARFLNFNENVEDILWIDSND